MHSIFISYSSKDLAQAETVRDILEKNHLSCWMAPRDIPGGSNYTKEIPIAIRSCQVFVLILSENSQSSHWVLKELDAAVNCGKVILPFMLEDCQLNDEFNFLLTGAQRYAAYQKKAEALEALILRIRAITDGNSIPTPSPAPSAPAQQETKPPKTASTYLGIEQCPSCGGSELEELTKRIGRDTFPEKLTALIAPVAALAGGLLGMVLATIILPFGRLSNDAETWIILGGFILCFAGCWILGSRLSQEWVRRQRVRRHIHQHPFRCIKCRKIFLLEDK